MKTFIVVCFFALVAIATALPGARYTDRYDNIDLDEILGNPRLLNPYILCLLEQGKCTAEGKELKSHIHESLENYCENCTEAQRKGARRVIGHLINNEPESWEKLNAKYDPEHKYTKKYEDELRTIKQ
uniref:Chemosensory protein n=1 Tax=Eogystia hippophaecolus TaxID=1206364 RepID=A0A1B3P5M3_EOGHI|nr:chemosensory protein [Eogystia hippophaecolus]